MVDTFSARPHRDDSPTLAGKKRLAWPVLLYLATVLVPLSTAIGPLVITDMRLLLLITTIPLTYRMLRGDYGGRQPTDILFLFFVAWITVALLVNNPGQAIQNAGSNGLEFFGGYILARAYIRSADDFIALARALFAITAITLLPAIYETITGQPIILNLLNHLPAINAGVLPAHAGQRLGLYRVQTVFAHPIHYGLFCTIAFSLAYIGMEGIYGPAKRFAISGLSAFCVFLSLSSGALLAILLQGVLIGWALVFRSVRIRWWLLVGLGVLAYVLVDVLSNRTPLKVFMTYATFSSGTAYWRLLILQWGMFNIFQNPIFGLGLRDWVRPLFMHTNSVDNFWLLIGMRYGIPGFCLLASGYVSGLFRVGLRPFAEGSTLWRLRRAWMFTFVGLTFTLFTVDVWGSMFSVTFFVFGAGMWFTTADPEAGPTAVETIDTAPLSFRRALVPKLAGAQHTTFARSAPPKPVPQPPSFTRPGGSTKMARDRQDPQRSAPPRFSRYSDPTDTRS